METSTSCLIFLPGWWFQPLWKIWVRKLGWWHSQYMESHRIPWFQSPPTSYGTYNYSDVYWFTNPINHINIYIYMYIMYISPYNAPYLSCYWSTKQLSTKPSTSQGFPQVDKLSKRRRRRHSIRTVFRSWRDAGRRNCWRGPQHLVVSWFATKMVVSGTLR